ncbi:MAG: IS3 family transposase [Chlamydiia bacterium]|nr:IS3 family transposase [Chlamydiia bacterium]
MRRTSQAVIERNRAILKRIEEIKSEHPFWGYRRVWAHLNFVDQMLVNKKRVYCLMKRHRLLVTQETKLRAIRTPRSKPKADRPDQLWGIDMTKIKVDELGWAYVVITLDWYTKKIVGHSVNIRSKTSDWLEALEKGLRTQFPQNCKGSGIQLVSDNGCQPTSEKFMRTCKQLGVSQIFTSFNNPKGNADTERMMRTLKEELLWLKEWKSYQELKTALDSWIKQYNRSYLHSALGYRSPESMERSYYEKRVA